MADLHPPLRIWVKGSSVHATQDGPPLRCKFCRRALTLEAQFFVDGDLAWHAAACPPDEPLAVD